MNLSSFRFKKGNQTCTIFIPILLTLLIMDATYTTAVMKSIDISCFETYISNVPGTNIQVEVKTLEIIESPSQNFFLTRIIEEAAWDFINESEYLLESSTYFKRETFLSLLNTTNNQTFFQPSPLIGVEGKLRWYVTQVLSQGIFPTNDNEAIIFVKNDTLTTSNITLFDEMNLYIPVGLDPSLSLFNEQAQTVLNITGIIIFEEISELYEITGKEMGLSLDFLFGLANQSAIFSTWAFAANILDNIVLTYSHADSYSSIFYNTSKINSSALSHETAFIAQLGDNIFDYFETIGYNNKIFNFLLDSLNYLLDNDLCYVDEVPSETKFEIIPSIPPLAINNPPSTSISAFTTPALIDILWPICASPLITNVAPSSTTISPFTKRAG